MPGENKKSEYRNAWIAEKLDRVNLTMPKGQKEAVKAHAEAHGESVNAFINRAIIETIERDSTATEQINEVGADGHPRTGKENV